MKLKHIVIIASTVFLNLFVFDHSICANRIHELADAGDTVELEEFLQSLQPVQRAILIDERGDSPYYHETPLHVAIQKKHEAAARMLLRFRADPTIDWAENVSPARLAACHNMLALALYLHGSAEDWDIEPDEAPLPIFWTGHGAKDSTAK